MNGKAPRKLLRGEWRNASDTENIRDGTGDSERHTRNTENTQGDRRGNDFGVRRRVKPFSALTSVHESSNVVSSTFTMPTQSPSVEPQNFGNSQQTLPTTQTTKE